jgi:hypothetical protein
VKRAEGLAKADEAHARAEAAAVQAKADADAKLEAAVAAADAEKANADADQAAENADADAQERLALRESEGLLAHGDAGDTPSTSTCRNCPSKGLGAGGTPDTTSGAPASSTFRICERLRSTDDANKVTTAPDDARNENVASTTWHWYSPLAPALSTNAWGGDETSSR